MEVRYTKKFQEDIKRMQKQGKNLDELYTVVNMLVTKQQLPQVYKDHALKGNYKGFRECHIKGDWLLIYRYDTNMEVLILVLARTGSHSNLF